MFHRLLIIFATFAVVLLIECGTLIWVDKNCFGISEELKLFPGVVGDSITLTGSSGGNRLLKIIKKYAYHISGYTTDTGCSCYDDWKVEMGSYNLSVSFSTSLQYLDGSEGTRIETVEVSNFGTITTFTEENKTVHSTYTVNGQVLEKVIEYRISSNLPNQVRAIFFAKNVGIAMLELSNGDTFTNSKLSTSNVTGTDTWEYREAWCE